MSTWKLTDRGVLRLPSGRLVRGRGLRNPEPDGTEPDFGVYLQGKQPPAMPWSWRWVRWPDWWLPADPVDARNGLVIVDGLEPAEAIRFVRQHYNPRAVENPWQRRWVSSFRPRKQ